MDHKFVPQVPGIFIIKSFLQEQEHRANAVFLFVSPFDDDEEYISSIDLLSAALGFKNNDEINNDEEIYEKSLLADLAHYSIYAHCAYGWKFGLLSGKLHLGDKAMLKKKIGIEKQHILSESWTSKTHLPAYFIVRDENRKKIVLTIRGTLSAKDVLTDLCAIKEEFLTHEEENLY